MDRSPLAPDEFPRLPAVAGVRLATAAAGLRYAGRDDLLLAEMAPGTTVGAMFTRSLCPSAPVDWCRSALEHGVGPARALVCNAGNANAFTGRAGDAVAARTAAAAAAELGVQPSEVMLASTGVIGEVPSVEPLSDALVALAGRLADSDADRWRRAADAIGTTDTFPKGSFASVGTDPVETHVVGVAKGSGMIAPDMATMLAFLFTDQPVATELLRPLLSESVDGSFNCISVDSDTSTSDTVLLFVTPGSPAAAPISSVDDPRYGELRTGVDSVCTDLARQIVRDGEGATKFVSVHVRGAQSDAAARTIGLTISNSPLVKTALAAADANWGRIVMAVGKAGEAADRDALSVWIGDEQCAEKGSPRRGYDEVRATDHLRGPEVEITVDVGVGEGRATVWTCDLTHGYIEINAGYRT